MKVKVKTLWGAGFVSVADKYVKKALETGQGLEIEYEGRVLNVSKEQLEAKNPRKGSFTDKFGRKKEYYLYDFFWDNK